MQENCSWITSCWIISATSATFHENSSAFIMIYMCRFACIHLYVWTFHVFSKKRVNLREHTTHNPTIGVQWLYSHFTLQIYTQWPLSSLPSTTTLTHVSYKGLRRFILHVSHVPLDIRSRIRPKFAKEGRLG